MRGKTLLGLSAFMLCVGFVNAYGATPDGTATSKPAEEKIGVWTRMLNWPRDAEPMSGEGLVVDPVRPSDFYFFYETGTPNAQGDRHVMKSTDFGATWQRIEKTKSKGNAWGVAIDPNRHRNPSTPPTMYTPAGYGDLGVWKSTDGGVTWVNLFAKCVNGEMPRKGGGTVTFPPDKNRIHVDFYQIHILPDNPPNHILVTYHYGANGKQALGESTDGGKTWEVHNVPFGESHYVYGLDAKTWVLIPGQGSMAGVYRTTTAGRVNGEISEAAWTKVAPFQHGHGFFTPWVDPRNGDIYFPASSQFGSGIELSHDGGITWKSIFDKGSIGFVIGTHKALYAGGIYNKTFVSAPLSHPTDFAATTPPGEGWWNGVPPYGIVTSFDGKHSVIIAAAYGVRDKDPRKNVNGEIWRYVEP